MRKTIQDMDWEELLPEPLRRDARISAMAKAISQQKRKIAEEIWRARVWLEIDRMPEEILDALAYDMDVRWYSWDYDLQLKREIMKSACMVYRTLGTVGAVKQAIGDVYAKAEVQEWWQYGGTPGMFRIYIDVTNTTAEHPTIVYSPAEMEQAITATKRLSAHVESLGYTVRHTLKTKCKIEKWPYNSPECGMIYCGEWWIPTTLGQISNAALATAPTADGFSAAPAESGAGDTSGRVLRTATLGQTSSGGAVIAPEVGAYPVTPARSGARRCGAVVKS